VGNHVANLPLLKGTLDLLVLKALSWGALHGYGIASWLEGQSGGTLGVEDSALYQALHRLEERSLVDAEWGVTENNRRARYYRLTRLGRKHLSTESNTWERYTKSVSAILSLQSPG
jgi:transcriptional regulator